MAAGDKKLRQMEEEMNRFEAEIAHQVTVPVAPTVPTAPLTGGFGFPSATAFVPPQLRVTPTVPVAPTVPLYVPMVQPSMPTYQAPILPSAMPRPSLPTSSQPTSVQPTTFTSRPSVSVSQSATTNQKFGNTTTATPAVITAPPQMAGPNELAARAKEAAAAAAAAKIMAEDDDDDVTRALLAAAAGVTYTRVQGPNGREQVRASITKPPLKLVSQQSSTEQTTAKSTAPAQVPQTTPTYRSVTTNTAPPQAPQPQSTQMQQLQQQQQQQQQQTVQVQQFYQQQIQQHLQQQQHQQQQQQQQSWKKKKRYIRVAAGVTWEDPTLAEWDPNDFRIFCGDLGNEVTDDTLTRAFNRYSSFLKAHVVRDKRTGRSRGYGFVSFSDPADFTRAMREMNGKYVGNRPIKLKRSDWRTRQLETVRKKEKEKKKLGLKN